MALGIGLYLTGKDTDDLMLMHEEMQTKYVKQLTSYFVNRGEVEEIKDYRGIQVI